jgi:alpha-D-xyloside xylohydrolase
MHFFDGSTGATMHNAYSRLQHEATREGIDEYLVEHPEREIFFFVRAGYSGRAGSAAFESATFPGDEAVDWSEENGLPSIVPDMLNRAVGGAYGFSTDIGGYADWTGIPGTSKELFVRWAQAAVFTTHFRVHGSAFNGVRMPWFFEPGDPEPKAEALWKAAADLHVRARPLILQLWQEAVDTGMPITRPMWLHDPSAEGNPHNDDQWMLGPDLLIAPVLEKSATQREVWLPEGCWQLHGEGEELGGRANVTVDAPLDVLPWFTRCGASPL